MKRRQGDERDEHCPECDQLVRRMLECGHPVTTEDTPGDLEWCGTCRTWRIIAE